MKNLGLFLDAAYSNNPFLVAALCDFNTKSSAWYEKDKTTYISSKIDTITFMSVY